MKTSPGCDGYGDHSLRMRAGELIDTTQIGLDARQCTVSRLIAIKIVHPSEYDHEAVVSGRGAREMASQRG